MRSISVVMPALNEQENIGKAIRDVLGGFSAFAIDGELVLVDDGSSDKTSEIMKEYLSLHPGKIKLIRHEKPRGIGASFWDGVKKAEKDAVVMMPGDAENDAAEILKYLGLMEQVDIIVPYVVNKEMRGLSRNIISGAFLSIINISFGLSLNYTNGTVVYRRAIFDDIKCMETGFFYQVEALVKSIRKGYIFAEVPCLLSKRSAGESKAIGFKSLLKVLKAYFRLYREIYITKTHLARKSFVPTSVAFRIRENNGQE